MDTTRFDLNLLLTLEALLLEQNVTRAAARLHLSQPAVSAQLSRLRLMFDDPLLLPAPRGMTPTAKALALLAPLRSALDQVRSTLVSHRHFDPASACFTLAIACTDYLQAVVVMPLLLALRQQAPGISVAVHHLDPSRLAAQMASGELDLALMTPACAPPGLHSRHLFDEHYVLIGRRDHPHLREGMTVAEYTQLEHVVVSLSGGGFVTAVDATLASLGLQRRVVLSAASFLLVPELVARSDFVALVPYRLVHERRETLKLVNFALPEAGFAVGMLWHERNQGHAGQQWLRETIAGLAGLETLAANL